ncbi:threonine/serine dehydratase [Rhizobium sp. R693]|uniref:threonine ammonia-lyase n=1 Tax=Rhizobium sp. R693 TaxID=1764276 RepID=UPI000B532E69|nr:threonine/serine dehydratase [Rhizobium sp. R693]OWV98795.1 threonine dehydratase [Rhizobium sp. R693]
MQDFSRLHHDIEAAAGRIGKYIVRTPLLESAWLNSKLGLRLLIKPENLQKTGSFKARGALNFLLRRDAGPTSSFAGYSSGNHAQGLAYAAMVCGSAATVIMPASAPARKVEGAKALGATVELIGDFFKSRQARVEQLVARGATLVPPFDHADIVAGQGTVGLEIVEDLQARSIQPELLAVPTSGGGLIAGTAAALKTRFPDCAVMAVEPRGFDDFAKSVEAGAPRGYEPGGSTICDGLMSPRPGALPFEVVRELRPSFETVSDDRVLEAIRLLFESFNIVAEPSGAAAFAAVVARAQSLKDKTVAVVVSGGNVDPAVFTRALRGASEDIFHV